jgi:hypothetical protein
MSFDQHEKSAVHELQHQPYEPLLPIEIKLIVWSLGLGLVLLAVLFAANSISGGH